jgi:hypothetical protein
MRAKISFIAGLLVMALAPGLSAQEVPPIEKAPLSASVALANIGFHVYADQVHTPFIAAVAKDAKDPQAPTLQAYYTALVLRGWLDLKSYSLPDTFLYASSLTSMDFFRQLKQILGQAQNTSFSRTVVVVDAQGKPLANVLTTIKLNAPMAHDGDDDDDDDHGQINSTDMIAVTFTSADKSRIALTYAERLKHSGAIAAEGTFKAVSGDKLTEAALAIKGSVESVNGARLLRVAKNAATRKTYNAAKKLVDSVESEHRGSYTIQDVAAWSYYNGMVSNERDSLLNLVTGVCGVTAPR